MAGEDIPNAVSPGKWFIMKRSPQNPKRLKENDMLKREKGEILLKH